MVRVLGVMEGLLIEIRRGLSTHWASLVAHTVKNLPAVQEIWVWSLGREDPLEKEMATHSSILARTALWTQEPLAHPWCYHQFKFEEPGLAQGQGTFGRNGNQVFRIVGKTWGGGLGARTSSQLVGTSNKDNWGLYLWHAAAAAARSRQLCPTLCNPIDGSQTGSTVPGILQARTLEWVAISFSNAWKWKVKVTPWTAAY